MIATPRLISAPHRGSYRRGSTKRNTACLTLEQNLVLQSLLFVQHFSSCTIDTDDVLSPCSITNAIDGMHKVTYIFCLPAKHSLATSKGVASVFLREAVVNLQLLCELTLTCYHTQTRNYIIGARPISVHILHPSSCRLCDANAKKLF